MKQPKFHFALPTTDTYLDRVLSFLNADPLATVWITAAINNISLPREVADRIRPICRGRRIPSQVAQWVFRYLLRNESSLAVDGVVLYSLSGLLNSAQAKLGKSKNVLTVHHNVSPSPRWFNDDMVPPSIRDEFLHTLRKQNLERERNAQKNADVIIVQAASHAKVMSDFYGNPLQSYHTIPNAVSAPRLGNVDGIPAQLLRTTQQRPSFVYAGNISKSKGVFDLLHAFRESKTASKEAQLMLVGRAKLPAIDAELTNFARELEIQERVIRVEYLPQPQLYALMQECCAVTHPSYFEGMPRVVLEAMSLGVPVVASNIPGIIEIDPNGSSIRMHAPGDIKAFADHLDAILEDEKSRGERVLEGKHLIERNHRPEVIGASIRETCQKALQQKMLS